MNRRLRVAWLGIPLVSALGAASLASAHGGHGNTGTVTQVTSTSITVQLKNGTSVTDELTANTRVSRNTTASTSDLAAGAVVSLTLSAAGSTTATAVHLEPSHPTRPTSTVTHKPVGTATHTPKVHTGATPTPKSGTKPHVNLRVGGTIVSATSGTITLKNRAGQSVTYTLAGNAALSKTVAGTLSDLKVGQVVSIGTPHGSTTAGSVSIISG